MELCRTLGNVWESEGLFWPAMWTSLPLCSLKVSLGFVRGTLEANE